MEENPPQAMPPPFRPHPWLPSGHLQTLASSFWTGRLRPEQATQHLIGLPDGDALVLHEDSPPGWQAGQPVVLMLHGLGGCHRSPYLVRLAERFNQEGIRTFRLDLRGVGAGIAHARGSYHAGRSEDLGAAIEFLTALCPAAPLGVAGFSLGANIVLKYLGERDSQKPRSLQAAVAVNPPVDLELCVQTIRRGWNRFYDKYFLRLLLRTLETRRKCRPDLLDVEWTQAPRSLYEFDDRFTAPVNGFASANEYYACSSAGPLLEYIAVPTLLLTAADDPLVPVSCIESFALSQHVQLEVTRSGGHLGYFAASESIHWMDQRLSEFWKEQFPNRPAVVG